MKQGPTASAPVGKATHFEVWVLVWSFAAYGVARVFSDLGITFLIQVFNPEILSQNLTNPGTQIWVQVFCLAFSLAVGKSLDHFSNPLGLSRGFTPNSLKLKDLKVFFKYQWSKFKGLRWGWLQDSLFWSALMTSVTVLIGTLSGLLSLEGFGLSLGTRVGLGWLVNFLGDVFVFCLFYFLLRKFISFVFSKFQVLEEAKNGWIIGLGFEFLVWAQVLNLATLELTWSLVINLSFATALSGFHGFILLSPKKEEMVIRFFSLIFAGFFIFGLPLGEWEPQSLFKVFEGPLLHKIHSKFHFFEQCPVPSLFAFLVFTGIGIFWLETRKWPRYWLNNF